MRERITEARLRSLAEAAAGENVTGTLYEPDSEDVLGLVAEVRRLRGLIVALNTAAIGYDRDYYSCDACDEDIGKPHKSNCPLGAIETEAGAIEAETAAPSESPEPQPVPLVDVGVCLRTGKPHRWNRRHAAGSRQGEGVPLRRLRPDAARRLPDRVLARRHRALDELPRAGYELFQIRRRLA